MALLGVRLEAGGHFRGHARPLQRLHDVATDRLRGDFRHHVVHSRQRILRIQTHVDALVDTRLLHRHGTGTGLVTERLA